MLENIWLQACARVTSMHLRRDEGQALVEYALILALISVVAIAALTTIGQRVLSKLNSVAGGLA